VIVGVCDRCGDEQHTTDATLETVTDYFGWTRTTTGDTCPWCVRRTAEDACGARPEPVEHRLGSAARRGPDVLAVDARQGREAAVAEAPLQRCGT
jgi:hypothetical protein